MLLEKQRGSTDQNRQHGKPRKASRLAQPLRMRRSCQRGEGSDHMLRRKYIGIGIHRINQRHRPAQQVLTGQLLRAELLTAGIQQKYGSGNRNGNTQVSTVAAEGIRIVQKRI